MNVAYFHGFLGDPSDADECNRRLSDVHVRGSRLGLAASWSTEVDRLGDSVRDCHALMGYSLGARLALGVAIERPNAVSALVLMSGSPGLAVEADRATRRRQDAVWCRRLLKQPISQFLHQWYRQPVFAGDPPVCLAQLQKERMNIDPQEQAQLLTTLSVSAQPDYRPRLHELQIPVLFLAGSRDTKYVELAYEMASRVPHGETRIVPGGGHIIHRSHPAACVSVIASFLRRI